MNVIHLEQRGDAKTDQEKTDDAEAEQGSGGQFYISCFHAEIPRIATLR
jgi:hypothetical protein